MGDKKAGSTPFAVLPDGGTIVASWTETFFPKTPDSFGEQTVTHWTLSLHGTPFRGFNPIEQKWMDEFDFRNLIESKRKEGNEPPLPVETLEDGRYLVKYTVHQFHHLGSVKADIEMRFDVKSMVMEFRPTYETSID